MSSWAKRKTPSPTDGWRSNHARRGKPFGLVVFIRIPEGLRTWGHQFWEYTSWHASERARDDAVLAANKAMELQRWHKPCALAKITRASEAMPTVRAYDPVATRPERQAAMT